MAANKSMDWDKLKVFHAAAEAGSFTHAGERLGLSQSAVSRQVSALEGELSVSLFHRHARGLILDYSVAENLILGQQHRFTRGVRLDQTLILDNARRQVAAYDIRPADPLLPARALSGGNQQKIVIAREMARAFQVLLAAQPTRGVDVGAIEFIHARLREARDAGKAILLVSADLAEILALSDRVGVMYGGKLVTVLARRDASEEVLGPYMTGAATEHAA